MLFWDKEKRKVIIIDVTVPNTHNTMETIADKQRKYCELQLEIKKDVGGGRCKRGSDCHLNDWSNTKTSACKY